MMAALVLRIPYPPTVMGIRALEVLLTDVEMPIEVAFDPFSGWTLRLVGPTSLCSRLGERLFVDYGIAYIVEDEWEQTASVI